MRKENVGDKNQSKALTNFGAGRSSLVARFTLLGCTLGILVGLFEGGLLFSIPRLPFHFLPDVRYIVWFLAPLTGLLFFGSLGLMAGLAASFPVLRKPWIAAVAAAALVGVVGAYVASALAWFHIWVTDMITNGSLATPALWFLLVFVSTLSAFRLGWIRFRRFFDRETAWPLAHWTKGILAAGAVFVSSLVFYAAVGSVPRLTVEASAPRPARGPNIILITLDTTRADHLSAYGYSRPTTPNIDRLAHQGVLFENAVASTSWTLPSHASIFTGLLPHQHGADWAAPLDLAPWTLAEVLSSRGYETAGFTANFYYSPAGWGMGQGFDLYDDDSFSLRHNLIQTLLGGLVVQPLYQNLVRFDRFDRRNAEQINRDIFRWFEHRSHLPFFLFINYLDPHSPYEAPRRYNRRFGQFSENLKRNPYASMGARVSKVLPADEQASLIAGYDNCLAYLDDQVAKLLDFLAGTSEGSKTIVIVTSDHGESFGEHRAYGHGWNLYRETVRVPLIIAGPGIPRERRIDHIARTRELFSTVLDLALGPKLPFQRTSLRRFWTPGFKSEHYDEVAVSELTPNHREPGRPPLISIMTSEWHLIHDAKGHVELYHWPTDPQENIDLAQSAEYQRALETLERRLREYIALSHRPWRWTEYLLALDRPGRPFLEEAMASQKLPPDVLASRLRVGASQAYFASSRSSVSHRPLPTDEQMVKSLPYQ